MSPRLPSVKACAEWCGGRWDLHQETTLWQPRITQSVSVSSGSRQGFVVVAHRVDSGLHSIGDHLLIGVCDERADGGHGLRESPPRGGGAACGAPCTAPEMTVETSRSPASGPPVEIRLVN